jgi:predicted nucleic acid-binding protein
MKELLIDAKVLLRFLTQDDPKQSPAAVALFESAEHGEIILHIDALAIAESIYVLSRQFRRTRVEIADKIKETLQTPGVRTSDYSLVQDALKRFAAVNVDFSDAWLAARAAESGRAVASFDRDLDKFEDVERMEPEE